MGNGKAGSKKASKAASLQQQVSEGDVDMEELTGRSNTATPGPSEDDIQSECWFVTSRVILVSFADYVWTT